MSGAIPPLPNTHSWRGAQLKHRDNFTLLLRKIIFFQSSSVGIALGYRLDYRGSRVRFPEEGRLGNFLFPTASRAALGPTHPPLQWVVGALSLGVKRPGREADHHLHQVPRSKNTWSYTSTPPIHLHGVVRS
jgi:hypothetical protein